MILDWSETKITPEFQLIVSVSSSSGGSIPLATPIIIIMSVYILTLLF